MPKTKPDAQLVRRKNFKVLAAQWGTLTNLAKKLEITPGYASQLQSGFRPFTEKTARKFEAQLGLPVGWIDEERHTVAAIPARVDHGLMLQARDLTEAVLEESGVKVSQAKFSDLVIMVYEDALERGSLNEGYVKRLIALAR